MVLIAAALLTLCLAACTGRGPALRPDPASTPFSSPDGQPRFALPEGIEILADSTERPLLTPEAGLPSFPLYERDRDAAARVLMAFVVDASGRVELPTATVLSTETSSEPAFTTQMSASAVPFVRRVCEWLPSARFRWRDTTRRALAYMPFVFRSTQPKRVVQTQQELTAEVDSILNAMRQSGVVPRPRPSALPPMAPQIDQLLRSMDEPAVLEFLDAQPHCDQYVGG